jgi:hypothetical protein
VADAVDLHRAALATTAPSARLRLDSAHSATALEFPRPPLRLALRKRTVALTGGAHDAVATAHVFDDGVVSILRPAAHPTGHRARCAGAARPPSCSSSRRRGSTPGRFEGGPVSAADLLAGAPIPALLLGETSTVPRPNPERGDVLGHYYPYLADDLAVVHWDCAFVSEPSGVEDVPDLLALATAQPLELRHHDALLGREPHHVHDEMEARGSRLRNVVTQRYRTLQRRTAALLLELSEVIERPENAVKIVGDRSLARVDQGAVRRFRLPAWQETVLRKQRLVAEVSHLIGDAADTSRAEWLEIAIIVLILFEIVSAFR